MLALVLALTVTIAFVPGLTAADDANLACAGGDGGGPVYVTDSGLELEDNHSAPDEGYPTFPDDETVALGTTVDVSFAAPGEASLRLERHSDGATCLAAIDAASHPVTVEPADGLSFTVDGSVDGLAVSDGDFADEPVAVASNASESFALTILDTGLDEGETVTAEDADLEAEVDADGAVRFELDAGERTASLAVEESSGGIGLPPPPPPAEPASFEFGEATLSATSLELGEALTVEVTVTNVGDEVGTKTVSLLVDGDRVDEVDIALAGGGEETVMLGHAFDAEGEFEVAVPDVLAESVSVVDPNAPDDADGESTESGDDSASADDHVPPAGEVTDSTDDGDDGFVGYGLILGLLALAVTVAYVFRRHRAS
ncbi:CARDB domain-containing protein [Halovivax gelatinilyticus]|uniref:CARDB domain-containing protein n=1 Tax=Halovivax gelatinilyticus TaxID=2961597 RepID=UPI0020CA3442|nr:CARDB domain-containing protein [Halovivax gelatinilyticus]